MDDGRVAILGVHTRAEPLLRAVLSSPSATLLLDTSLSDACSVELLLRIHLRRPCPVVALCPILGSEHAVEMIRAGAVDCLVWQDTPQAAAAVATALLTAARSSGEPVRFVPAPVARHSAAAAAKPSPARRLVLLIGSRRATLLCDALAHLPADFPAALLCCQPVDPSCTQLFAQQLAREAPLEVTTAAARPPLSDGAVYLLERHDRLVVDDRSSGQISMRLVRASSAEQRRGSQAASAEPTWLDSMAASLSHRDLDVVTVSAGHLDAATIAILSRMLSVGVALARNVPGGYQIRWPDADDVLRFSATAFWQHLGTRLATRAANTRPPDTATARHGV